MTDKKTAEKTMIGRAELLEFPELGISGVPARIDTGAKTSAIWATNIQEQDGVLTFVLFSNESSLHTGEAHMAEHFEKVAVASSNGQVEERYKVQLLVRLKGRKVRGRFTLAERSQQAYPVLVGRNILHGKFVVDVQSGKPLYKEERERSRELQAKLAEKG